ncbi:MAG TPA: copper resistance protein B [Phenylobacterium sp.]|uniref:copper resistance protein B n=1 Tax=Phenylobacterium sp. TaxID=1871053 RepID=UPI002B6AEFE3|nr:copper resistance protein B [Phenylobacterium sp.]HXA38756.1 copper resistance protein B [Phenylobacterium sp.]
MNRLALIALAPLAFAEPAFAQAMDPSMPGMTMPAAKPPAKPGTPSPLGVLPGVQAPAAPSAPAAPAMADMPGMKGMAAPATPKPAPAEAAPAEPEIPQTPSPPPAQDHAADRDYDPAAMGAARAQLRQEHGGATLSMLMANLAEYQAGAGGGYRWDGEGRIGGDIDRFVVKSEGSGTGRGGLDAAEVQGLFSRAVTPYFDLQAGVRQDVAPYARTYATVGFEGLAPYWFDLSGALFLSTRGELLARVESTYDLRLTQRLILQPRVELNFAAQDTTETRTGSGLSNAELGLRLRYEITREFAPYIGVSWDRKLGRTADYARARGDDVGGAVLVTGIRGFF